MPDRTILNLHLGNHHGHVQGVPIEPPVLVTGVQMI